MADTRGGSTLLKTEDWLAVWLGFLIIVLVLAGVRPDMPKFRWATDGGFAATVADQKPAVDKLAKDAEAKGEKDLAAARHLKSAMAPRSATGSAAKKLGEAAKAKDAGLKRGRPREGGGCRRLSRQGVSGENLWKAIVLGISWSCRPSASPPGREHKYVVDFPVVYVLAWLSQIARQPSVNYWGWRSSSRCSSAS